MEDELKKIYNELKVHSDFRLFDKVFSLYELKRIQGSTSEDEDMLLFQWGMYSFDGPEYFELDITRQLCTSDPDDDIFQLRSTLYFMSTDELRQFDAGNKWCASPDNLANFKKFVIESTPYLTCSYMNPLKSVVEYGRV